MKLFALALMLLGVVFLAFQSPAPAQAADAPRMTTAELGKRLGQKDLVVIDVRQPSDWSKSVRKIKTALRMNPRNFDEWAPKLEPGKTYVFY